VPKICEPELKATAERLVFEAARDNNWAKEVGLAGGT
jgi:hypothetical protein